MVAASSSISSSLDLMALTVRFSMTFEKVSPMIAISMFSIVTCEMKVAQMKKM